MRNVDAAAIDQRGLARVAVGLGVDLDAKAVDDGRTGRRVVEAHAERGVAGETLEDEDVGHVTVSPMSKRRVCTGAPSGVVTSESMNTMRSAYVAEAGRRGRRRSHSVR